MSRENVTFTQAVVVWIALLIGIAVGLASRSLWNWLAQPAHSASTYLSPDHQLEIAVEEFDPGSDSGQTRFTFRICPAGSDLNNPDNFDGDIYQINETSDVPFLRPPPYWSGTKAIVVLREDWRIEAETASDSPEWRSIRSKASISSTQSTTASTQK